MALKKPAVTAETNAAVAEETLQTQGVEATQEQQLEIEVADSVSEVVETSESTEVVVAAEAQPPVANAAQQQRSAMANFSSAMAQEGFEGLDLTGMSFDRIKLHEGQFKLGQEDIELGTEFDCIIHSTRRLFVVRQSTDNDAESFYSYDPKGQTLTDGASSSDKLQEWLEDGYGTEEAPLDIREYCEATATLVNRDDEFNDQMVMLSIPPASRARLAGAAAQAYQKLKGALLSDVIISCQVGRKAGEGQKSFRPWVFKVVGRV